MPHTSANIVMRSWAELLRRYHRHTAMNDIIYRALTSAHMPARLEPSGVMARDLMAFLLSHGNLGSFLCGMLTPSHLHIEVWRFMLLVLLQLGQRKNTQICYTAIEFVSVVVETSGVFRPQTLSSVKELGKRLRCQTGEDKFTYLFQRLSIAVRGNAILSWGLTAVDTFNLPFDIYLLSL